MIASVFLLAGCVGQSEKPVLLGEKPETSNLMFLLRQDEDALNGNVVLIAKISNLGSTPVCLTSINSQYFPALMVFDKSGREIEAPTMEIFPVESNPIAVYVFKIEPGETLEAIQQLNRSYFEDSARTVILNDGANGCPSDGRTTLGSGGLDSFNQERVRIRSNELALTW